MDLAPEAKTGKARHAPSFFVSLCLRAKSFLGLTPKDDPPFERITEPDPIRLEIFNSLFMAIAEEMGGAGGATVAAEVLGPDEVARPQAATVGAGVCLLALVGAVGDRPAVADHAGVEVDVAGAAAGEAAAVLVESGPVAHDRTTGDESGEVFARLGAAGVAHALQAAGLDALGGIDAEEANAGAVDGEAVANDFVQILLDYKAGKNS